MHIVAGLLCAAFVVLLLLAGLMRSIADGLRRVTLPLVDGTASMSQGAGGFWARWTDMWQAESKLEALQQQYVQLRVDETHLQALETENRSLQAQAHFLNQTGYDSVGAHVIHRDIHQGRALLLLDRGANDGVEVGDAAVTDNGVLIGEITSVQEQISTVQLLTDPLSRISAAEGASSTLVGVVEGQGDGTASLDYIPATALLVPDQLIVSAGIEDKIPAHLAIGVIDMVQGTSSDPFLHASLAPLVDANRVFLVSILRPSVLKPK